MADILIVEDEAPINSLIRRNLELVGHNCYAAFDGRAALEEIRRHPCDLVLLDVMLPGLDGFEVFKNLKNVPTIFLTAKGDLCDRVKGLNMGADDYLAKPFEMLELLARVDAVLRRTRRADKVFQLDHLTIWFDSHQVYFNETAVECTPKEFDLLEALVKNRNIALSRDKLLQIVWGCDYLGDTRTVDVHIQKLRKKLGLEDRIKTVYKLGYRLDA